MRFLFFISFAVVPIAIGMISCTKARKCECYDKALDTKEVFYINGTKKDSKNACINLADSNEVCTLF
ncbi:MAG TPA: hypothetical protein VN026_16145 [Bacteroidia bacterium]|nr:hypothetical protein [Bacteroidia bacterium]